MKTLIVTDNEFLYKNFVEILKRKNYDLNNFDFRFSFRNEELKKKYSDSKIFLPINVKEKVDYILTNYDLIISLHCKQIFPKKLVNNITCINIHPGFNPYNRGWYPQVFSIINKLPIGVTIHKMDEELDHGEILYREKLEINSWETSKDVYDKILELEIKLIEKNIGNILEGNYTLTKPEEEGNVNYIKDFNMLREIDLDEKLTFREAIDRLRALTHGDYRNAYFVDEKGIKVWVKIVLEKDSENNEKI
ncbi:MAG: dTDP-4-amino-4,6-dideoxyglucose formyltransferase [Rikenellaceae bacterium]|nr:dTDP-4-amino-4,6-dideoxyglucose formyltransferase [Rikenellaceae bacterium]